MEPDLHPIEVVARQFMGISRDSFNIWLSLAAQDCALHLRKRLAWHVYASPDDEPWDPSEQRRALKALGLLQDALIMVNGLLTGRVVGDVVREAKEALEGD